MTVIAIEHIQLAMPLGREEEARAFYAGLLGIPEVPKPAHLAVRGGAWFEAGGVKVHLGIEEASGRRARRIQPSSLRAWKSWWGAYARLGARSRRISRSRAGSGSTLRTRSGTGSSLWSALPCKPSGSPQPAFRAYLASHSL